LHSSLRQVLFPLSILLFLEYYLLLHLFLLAMFFKLLTQLLFLLLQLLSLRDFLLLSFNLGIATALTLFRLLVGLDSGFGVYVI